MSTLRLKSKIYNLFLGILIAVLTILGEIYLSKTLSGIKLPLLVNFVIGTAVGALFVAFLIRGAYHRVFSSVKDVSLRRVVINVITLLVILLSIELMVLIYICLIYLFKFSLGYFVGFVVVYFVLLMLLNDALIYMYVRGLGVRDGRLILIRLVSNDKYNGFTINMLYHDLVIAMYPEEFDKCAVDVVDVHEGYHARHKHTLILNAILFIGLSMLVYYGRRGYPMLWTALPFLVTSLIVLTRTFELLADRAVHRRLGPKSLEGFRMVLKSLFGIDDPRRAPIRSRFTHPGKRDLAFLYGDVVGAYAPWEFPLLASFFAGFVTTGIYPVPPVDVYIKLASLIYIGVVIGLFLLTMLLGIVYRPIIRWFGEGLGDDSVIDLSMIDASIFTMGSAMSFVFYSIYHSWLYSNITAIAISFIFSLLVTWFALRNLRRALLTAVSITLIFIALDYLYYVMVPLIHVLYFR
jgi:hypothetical protein